MGLAKIAVVGTGVVRFRYKGAWLEPARAHWFGVPAETSPEARWNLCQSLVLVSARPQPARHTGAPGAVTEERFSHALSTTVRSGLPAPSGDAVLWPLDEGGELRLQPVFDGGLLSDVRWYQNRENLAAPLIYPNEKGIINAYGKPGRTSATLTKKPLTTWQPAGPDGLRQRWYLHSADVNEAALST